MSFSYRFRQAQLLKSHSKGQCGVTEQSQEEKMAQTYL